MTTSIGKLEVPLRDWSDEDLKVEILAFSRAPGTTSGARDMWARALRKEWDRRLLEGAMQEAENMTLGDIEEAAGW